MTDRSKISKAQGYVSLLKHRGLEEKIEEMVHDTAASLAASANNGGLIDQVWFLLDNDAEDDLRKLIREKQ